MILAVAAGVGSLTGVRGFSRAFHTMLQRDARTFMAADLTVRTFQLPTGPQTAEMNALAKRGIERTQVTETLTMASPPNGAAPLLISVKAVDPAVYPFYGTVKFNPPMDVRTALQPDTVAVSDGVLLRLSAHVGDTIRIGGQPFRISAEVTNEPDRMTGSLNVGPRVMMSRAGLARTGLLIAGSRAAERFLFKVPPAIPIGTVRDELNNVFQRRPDRRLQRGASADRTGPAAIDYIPFAGQPDRAGHRRAGRGDGYSGAPAAEDGFDRDHEMPGGEVGVRCCAFTSCKPRDWGWPAAWPASRSAVWCRWLSRCFSPVIFRFRWRRTSTSFRRLQGLAVGLLTVLLFTVPPLLGIRDIRPALIFRREMAAPPAGFEGLVEARGGFRYLGGRDPRVRRTASRPG